MKEFCYRVIGVLFAAISCGRVFAQGDKENLRQKQVRAEVAADSDQYVIGRKDILHINVWKEEALSRTVLVRIDGKISLPLIDEIHASGLTPLRLKELLIEKYKDFVTIQYFRNGHGATALRSMFRAR